MSNSNESNAAPQLYTEGCISELFSISTKTLQRWRYTGVGPNYIKIGGSVRYRRDDILQYVDENTVVFDAVSKN